MLEGLLKPLIQYLHENNHIDMPNHIDCVILYLKANTEYLITLFHNAEGFTWSDQDDKRDN